MKNAQENELVTVENAQKIQFNEFSSAWDQYMSDYEAAAFESVERLKEKHIFEIKELHDKVKSSFKITYKFSKELMDMRKQEKIFFSLKDYDKAEAIRRLADKQEQRERAASEFQLADQVAK